MINKRDNRNVILMRISYNKGSKMLNINKLKPTETEIEKDRHIIHAYIEQYKLYNNRKRKFNKYLRLNTIQIIAYFYKSI